MTSKELENKLIKKVIDCNGVIVYDFTPIIDEIKTNLDKLEELTKIPTEEEIKKEWEELGYSWKEDEIFIILINQKNAKSFEINKKLKDYKCYDLFRTPTLLHSNNVALYISLQEHQLLTKTFKMKGWEV